MSRPVSLSAPLRAGRLIAGALALAAATLCLPAAAADKIKVGVVALSSAALPFYVAMNRRCSTPTWRSRKYR